ncbi:hypothetical protein FNV43_RR01705 [Rhamnella rubrinervis]|uniref:Uncharacterized protein n=1 Tax=Rhamnella rubrinervis TaxID=2594499 RepID=A0A8K0HST7_9ROSA|nr:hypothetical protein FNV43_RR01705 [Rhamnella rubrinervis]
MATGATVKLSNSAGYALVHHNNHVWRGQNPVYPERIENGKSEKFKHDADKDGAAEAVVVYRMADTFDWLVSWYVAPTAENHVYTEIGAPGSFDKDWDSIKANLEKASSDGKFTYVAQTVEYTAVVNIEKGTSPGLTASIESSGSAAGSSAN